MGASRSTLAAVAAGSLLTLGVGGAAVLAGSGALAAGSPSPAASTPNSSTRPTAPDGTSGRGHGMELGGRGLMGGDVLHGEVVVKKADGSGTETLLVQHGTITAKGSDTVTIKSSDGFTLTWAVTSSTRIPKPWTAGTRPTPPATRPTPPATPPAVPSPAGGTLADLAVGADVQAAGPKSGSGATARMIFSRPAIPAGQAGTGGFGGFGGPGRGFGPGHDGHGWGPGGSAPSPKPTASTSSSSTRT